MIRDYVRFREHTLDHMVIFRNFNTQCSCPDCRSFCVSFMSWSIISYVLTLKRMIHTDCWCIFVVMMSKTVDYAILFSNCFILKVIYSQTPDNHIHVLLVITSQSLLLGYVWPSRHIGSLSFGGMFFRQIWMFVKSPDARCLSFEWIY